MSSLVFVKTSSLGDIVHHMPAVSDARRALPNAHIAWVVEEPYVALARLHSGVDSVLSVATRRWRKHWHSPDVLRQMRTATTALRSRAYDEIIDTQGLARTGVLTRLLRGRRHGYDAESIREKIATYFYDVRHPVPRALHAIDRNRLLTGAALGYTPQGALDFGLRVPERGAGADYAVLLHGSAEARKEWDEDNWLAVGRALKAAGLRSILPWGSPRERERAERLAKRLPGAEVRGGQGLEAVAETLAGARIVVGLDTGLAHLAAAFAVPLIAIFIASDPRLTAPRGVGMIDVLGSRGAAPSPAAVIVSIDRMLAG